MSAMNQSADRKSANTTSSADTRGSTDLDNGREMETDTESPVQERRSTKDGLQPVEPPIETPKPAAPAFDAEAEKNYKPKTVKFWLVVLCAAVSMFLVALDRTIISTAIPQITNDFQSLGDIGWYGSAYMLTGAAFQLVFGRVYRFYDLRWTFLGTIVLFEIGSAICGAAPNSPAFIIGRAIAGIGSAGITIGAVMAIVAMVPLRKRPMFQSMFGIVFGVASITGPLIGGTFTGQVTWRWCFYMNLPIGAVAFVLLLLFLDSPKKKRESVSWKTHAMRLDPIGCLFFIPSMVCLILALQWGGSTYPWSNWRLILLFVIFGLTAIAYAVVQVKMPESATIPMRVIKQRTMLAGAWFMFFLAGAMMLVVYYVPLWLQATKGVDPVKSGIYTIPLVLSIVVASVISAAITQRIGYYVPAMVVCPCIMAVGEGLLSTFQPTTGSPHWIAYQFLVGFGLGIGMQTVGLAVQATLPKEDVSTGMAINFFCQQLGGAIFVSVGQTILSGLLVDKLSHVPGLDAKTIVQTGATDLRHVVPSKHLDAVVGAYNYACTRIFLAAMALSLAQLVCAFFSEWKSIKKGGKQPDSAKMETGMPSGKEKVSGDLS